MQVHHRGELLCGAGLPLAGRFFRVRDRDPPSCLQLGVTALPGVSEALTSPRPLASWGSIVDSGGGNDMFRLRPHLPGFECPF